MYVAAQPAYVHPCFWLSLVMYTRSLQGIMDNESTWNVERAFCRELIFH
jgi:hypothetical protein